MKRTTSAAELKRMAALEQENAGLKSERDRLRADTESAWGLVKAHEDREEARQRAGRWPR